MSTLRWLRPRALARQVGSLAHELGTAAFAALVLLLGFGLVVGALVPAYRLNWIWLRGSLAVDLLSAAVGLGLLASWWRPGNRGVRIVTAACAAALAACALRDAAGFSELVADGQILSALAFPLSALVAAAFAVGAIDRLRAPVRRHVVRRGVGVVVAGGLLALAHVATFGATDYRRPADAAVVFGAAVRPDGTASLALRDRTMTACDLYEQGLVDTLVFSGGRDPQAPLSEPACMAQLALARGIPEKAFVYDEHGATTRDSIDRVHELAAEHGWERVLLVSHDYHLARISMTAHRRGLRAFTVPARESRAWRGKSYFVLREVAALAWYAVFDL